MMKSIEEEIRELEEQYEASRNTVERATIYSKIGELKGKLAKTEQKEKKVVKQNNAPSVADHKGGRRSPSRGDIANAGSAFVGII